MTNIRALVCGEDKLIGGIIGDSFSNDPVNTWVFGRQLGMTSFFEKVAKKLYLKNGFGHVMENNLGGSLWLPNGVKKDIPLLNSFDIAGSMIKHNGIKALFRGLAVESELSKKIPKEPHYYLFAVGARQGQQGQGIGKKLMEAGLAQVDKANMPAYLESSKEANVGFYQKFGFEVLEQIVPTKGCPPMWLMWRKANS